MFNPLTAPGIDGMEMAVAALDDGGVGVLGNWTVFQGDPVTPVDAVITAEDGQWRTGTFLLGRFDGPVVADKGVFRWNIEN